MSVRRHPSWACVSAHRTATALAARRSGHSEPRANRALRADLAPPVRSNAPCSSEHAASGVAQRAQDARPDASLEVLVPFSAPAPRRAHAEAMPSRTGDPASTLAGCRSLLRPDASRRDVRVRCPGHRPTTASQHRSPTHRAALARPCGFSLGGDGPIDSARIDAARFDRDAPPFPSASLLRARVRARRGSCAGAFLTAGVPLPAVRVTWPGRAPFRRRSFPGFPSRERSRSRWIGRMSRV